LVRCSIRHDQTPSFPPCTLDHCIHKHTHTRTDVNGTSAASKRHDTRDVLRRAHIISLSPSSTVAKDALKTPRSPACALAAPAGGPFTLRMAHRLPPQSGEDKAFSAAPTAPTAAPTHMSPIPIGAKHQCHGVGIPKHSFTVLMLLPLPSRASARAAGESDSVSVSPCSRICQRAFKPS
jgi:hypothetical protein